MKVNCEHCQSELELADDVVAVECGCGKWYKRCGSVTAWMALENAGKKKQTKIPEESKLTDKRYLEVVVQMLDNAERITTGTWEGIEGHKIIQLTDELAKEVAERLREIAKEL
jgi:hypothetical protein